VLKLNQNNRWLMTLWSVRCLDDSN